MFKEGFYELCNLLEKQKGSHKHIRCHAFNTRANRSVIVCSVITSFFENLGNVAANRKKEIKIQKENNA
jgi:hypothetical protein